MVSQVAQSFPVLPAVRRRHQVRRRLQVRHLPGVHCGETSCHCVLDLMSPQASCAYVSNLNS